MTINWFEQHFQLNAMGTALSIVFTCIVIVAVSLLQAKGMAKKKWHCPNCNRTFQKKWFQCLLRPHVNDDFLLLCPHCGEKNLCWEAKSGDKNDECADKKHE